MDLYVPGELRSKESLRFTFVREQGYDRSCGYSAAASLLSLYWSLPTEERELIERYASGPAESPRLAVDFVGLSRIFSDRGLSVKGVRMGWDQLEAALAKVAPVIVHYDRPDRHFALALRISDGWIITLDPARGCELLRRGQFMERWSGAALLVASSSLGRDEERLAEAIRLGDDRRDLFEKRLRL